MDKWSAQVMYAALVITVGGGLSAMSDMIPTANYPSTASYVQQLAVSPKQEAPKAVVKVKATSKSVALRLFSAKTDRRVRAYAMN